MKKNGWRISAFFVICYFYSQCNCLYSKTDENVVDLLRKANQYEKQEKWGNALVQYLKIREILPADRSIEEYIFNSVDQILEKTTINLGFIIPLNSGIKDADTACRIFTDDVYSNAFALKPRMLELLEKEKLTELVNLHKIFAANERINLGSLKNIKQLNYVNVITIISHDIVSHESVPEKKIKAYTLKEEKTLNPDWVAADEQVKNLRNQLDEANRIKNQATLKNDPITAIDAATSVISILSNLQKAEDIQRGLEKYNKKKILDEWHYTVQHEKKTGTIDVKFNIYDVDSTSLVASGQLEKKVSFEDSWIDNPNPKLDIPDDPLNLPSDETISYRLCNMASIEIVNRIFQKLLNIKAEEYFNSVENSYRIKKIDQTIEGGVLFLLECNTSWSKRHERIRNILKSIAQIDWDEKLSGQLINRES